MHPSLANVIRVAKGNVTLPAVLGTASLMCVLCASCTSTRARGPALQNQQLATTAPAAQPQPPNQVDRLTASRPMLKQAWEAYQANEGDGKRARHFYELSFLLDQTCFSGSITQTRTLPPERATELEVLSFLGLPEYRGKIEGWNQYHYSFWRADTHERWTAVVMTRDGKLESVGYTVPALVDYSLLEPVQAWSDVLPK